MGLYLQHKYVNRFDKRGCKEIDDFATSLFLKKVAEHGWTATKATNRQDAYEHWDWKLTKEGRTILVDVKGLKRIDSTKEQDDSLICLEHTNVAGNIGWLRGQSDYIAFLLKEGFSFVDTKRLLAYSKTVINWDGPVLPSPQGKKPYVVYQRSQWGRLDLVAYVTKKEIQQLTTYYM